VCERIPYLILLVRQSSREQLGSRRNDTRKLSGCCQACIERTAAGILASHQADAGLVSNEPPPGYSQAIRPPSGLRRTNRRRDTRKPSGRRRACVE